VLEGRLRPGATGKDVIITLCGLYNRDEVLNAALEFAGPGVTGLSMDARLSVSNMTTEWGALVGWFPVDETTIAYLQATERFGEEQIMQWRENPPAPDGDAAYAARIRLNLEDVTPHVSGPDSVKVMTPLAELERKHVPIHKAYLVSCVNSRLEDLEAAAGAIEGKKVTPGVGFYLAAASLAVQEEAERRGIWKTLTDAGAIALPPGCGPCIGLGTGLLEAGEVGISATNRNFKGRMGSREAQCYLASPAVVAASAAAGFIRGPQPSAPGAPERRYEEVSAPGRQGETVEILPGFPHQVRGRLVFLPQDNLNTDGIYGKDYTYRDDMTPEVMAKVVMENYDPEFAGRTEAGDVVVGGFNFGTGSSREQAVTALMAKGIPLVIAGSFSQTYLRNAFNNGFLCIEVPDFVSSLRRQVTAEGTPGRTIIPGDDVHIDLASGTVRYREASFGFNPLGAVPQSLVAAGGIENLVNTRLSESRH
jgi:homoaconitate hydratase